MVPSVTLSQVDVKEILAEYFQVDIKNIITTRYSFVVANADITKIMQRKAGNRRATDQLDK